MHSHSKEQREAVRQLVHAVLVRDMSTFTPERFTEWIKDLDAKFSRVGLTVAFAIRDRAVHFAISEKRTRKCAYRFGSSTRVTFSEEDVIARV